MLVNALTVIVFPPEESVALPGRRKKKFELPDVIATLKAPGPKVPEIPLAPPVVVRPPAGVITTVPATALGTRVPKSSVAVFVTVICARLALEEKRKTATARTREIRVMRILPACAGNGAAGEAPWPPRRPAGDQL